jgi:hypothetical protein
MRTLIGAAYNYLLPLYSFPPEVCPMTKVSALVHTLGAVSFGILVLAIGGCSGGSDTPVAANPPASPPTPPAAIEGIATPSSVAVVTATNAE